MLFTCTCRQQSVTTDKKHPWKRIFNHCLDAILPEDDNSLDRPTIVADSIEDILWKFTQLKKEKKKKSPQLRNRGSCWIKLNTSKMAGQIYSFNLTYHAAKDTITTTTIHISWFDVFHQDFLLSRVVSLHEFTLAAEPPPPKVFIIVTTMLYLCIYRSDGVDGIHDGQ